MSARPPRLPLRKRKPCLYVGVKRGRSGSFCRAPYGSLEMKGSQCPVIAKWYIWMAPDTGSDSGNRYKITGIQELQEC